MVFRPTTLKSFEIVSIACSRMCPDLATLVNDMAGISHGQQHSWAAALATAARIAQEEPVSRLSSKRCVPCRDGMPSLAADESKALLGELDGWTIADGPRLTKTWKFPDFATALAFVNRIGVIADAEDHHPDIALSWGKVGVELWTHAASGLTENDFIVAAKVDDAKSAS